MIRESESEVPEAVVQPLASKNIFKQGGWWWAISALCLIVAAGLTAASIPSGGVKIVIEFQRGYGIKAGDALQHRGIDVGEVTSVRLSDSLEAVEVEVLLESQAVQLGREGSEFWIERPQLSLSRISGLETVVGAKHLSIHPGPASAAPATRFVGLPAPPVLDGVTSRELTIHFREGNGLEAGDVVKYRGIVVGEVTAVRLDEKLKGVDVRVRLADSSKNLARKGSQFWIERPRVSLAEVRGLDTVVTGVYVGVAPGAADGDWQGAFEGLTSPPANIERNEGGLEIVLYSKNRYGVQKGAPVTFRGLTIGHVVDVGLAPDAVEVLTHAYIDPDFRQLVREQSKFWSISGVKIDVSVTGVKLDYETLATIAAGGVAMSTPVEGGAMARTGQRFAMTKKADDDWLNYGASIPIGSAMLPAGSTTPVVRRTSLNWRTPRLGLRRQRSGWTLPLDDGQILGPTQLLAPEEAASEDGFSLEVDGKVVPLSEATIVEHGALALCRLPGQQTFAKAWKWTDIRRAAVPEDCLLIPTSPSGAAVPLAAARLKNQEDRWLVTSQQSFDEQWHGAAVLATRDGALIGLLLVEKGKAEVTPLAFEKSVPPPDWLCQAE